MLQRLATLVLLAALSYLMIVSVRADVIMMGGDGAPSIIEDDEFGQDVILMPGMSSMLINEDLVFMG